MKTDTFVVHWRAAEESGAYFLVVSFRRERGVVNATKRLFNVFRIVGGCGTRCGIPYAFNNSSLSRDCFRIGVCPIILTRRCDPVQVVDCSHNVHCHPFDLSSCLSNNAVFPT